jgi:cytochrome c peroxidase
MKLKIITLQLLVTTLLFSATTSLVEKAKEGGLIPIPTTKTELLKMIDPKKVLTPQRVDLGKMLFFDPRLSKSSLISCNWCHNLALGGVDGISKAIGHQWTGNPMHLNSPTVYNAVFAKRQFWDGRSPDLEDQAQGPIQAGVEMAAPKELIEQRINSIPEYVELFHKAYKTKKKVTFKQIADTIAIFERTLVTPSRYDDFLNGKKDALSKKEKEGLEIFIDKGCVTCHNGIALGGELKPFELKKRYKYRDVGDFIGKYKKMIKVPTLRNITETAPYFHNGMIWDLKEAIKEMGKVQVGYKIKSDKKTNNFSVDIMPISLNSKDIDKIYAFLQSLEGEKPKIEYLQLPTSSIKTARPNEK